MVFLTKELIQLAPFGRTAFFNRLSEIKRKRKIKKIGGFYPQDEALKIAKELGFFTELQNYINTKSQTKKAANT